MQTANQDVPDLNKFTPIFLVDVWEHAYYLQYQNRRADYVDGWFSLINWRKAQKRYVVVAAKSIASIVLLLYFDGRLLPVRSLYRFGGHFCYSEVFAESP